MFAFAPCFAFIFAGVVQQQHISEICHAKTERKYPEYKRNKTTREWKKKEKRSSREKRAKYTLHNAHTIFSEKKSLMKIYDFVNV